MGVRGRTPSKFGTRMFKKRKAVRSGWEARVTERATRGLPPAARQTTDHCAAARDTTHPTSPPPPQPERQEYSRTTLA